MTPEFFHAHRIKVDIAVDSQSRFARIVERGFEPTLEQGTDSPVSPVKPGSVSEIEPLHGWTEVGLQRFELQMIMVAHQDIAVDPNGESIRELTEKLQKETSARLVRKDRSSFHSATDDMEPSAGDIEP